MLRNAIIKGEESGEDSILDINEIRQEAKAEMQSKSPKK